jgi:hypothetical protein
MSSGLCPTIQLIQDCLTASESFKERSVQSFIKQDKKRNAKVRKWKSFQLQNTFIRYSEQCVWTLYFDEKSISQSYDKALYMLKNYQLPKEIFKISCAVSNRPNGTPLLFFFGKSL